jgi:biotin--protein ligase
MYSIRTINAHEVGLGIWTADAALFVMPGGADLSYVAKLNGVGNTIIKAYVQNGGSFLGICAGSYYASQRVEFDVGGSLEVIGMRELQFFPGSAIGPVLAPYDYYSNSGMRAANISITMRDYTGYAHLFFNGGPYFQDAQTFTNVSVVGWYQTEEENLPAILDISYGNGRAVLSGVHFEYDPDVLAYSYRLTLPDLFKQNDAQKCVTQKIFEILGLIPKYDFCVSNV